MCLLEDDDNDEDSLLVIIAQESWFVRYEALSGYTAMIAG